MGKQHTLAPVVFAASFSGVQQFYAQRGMWHFPFGNMKQIIKAFEAEGLSCQQSDGERVLVANRAWVTIHGVVTPVNNTSNL